MTGGPGVLGQLLQQFVGAVGFIDGRQALGQFEAGFIPSYRVRSSDNGALKMRQGLVATLDLKIIPGKAFICLKTLWVMFKGLLQQWKGIFIELEI